MNIRSSLRKIKLDVSTAAITALKVCGAVLMAVAVAGCGGGGGGGAGGGAAASSIITGTAAAGAPVVGYVSVRDSSTKPQPVLTNIPIAADGKYTVDVTGLTAPFAFLADGNVGGKRVQLYSAATQADVGGTINITPFTDLIVRNVAATTVDTLMTSANLANFTTAQINAKRDQLTTQLTAVMQAAGLSTSIDLMRASFNADGTGLDRFMDLVKVDTTVPTAVTITNILSAAAPITINPQTGTSTGTISTAGITASTTPTPVDLINQTFTSFGGFFATSLPNPANTGLTGLFASTFLFDGRGSSAFLTEITTAQNAVGMSFAANSLVVNSVDTVNGLAQVSFVPVDATGKHLAQGEPGGALHWRMKLVAGKWLFDGNQRKAHVRVHATAGRVVCLPASSFCTGGSATGLDLWIDNPGRYPIGSAVVTGPGLPGGGVTLSASANQSWLTLPPCNTACISQTLYPMNDNTINTIAANSTYTITVYDNVTPTPNVLETDTEVLPVAPVLNSALATLAFPALSNTVSLVNYAGGTLTPTWTMPSGLLGDIVNVYLTQTGTNATLNVMQDLMNKTGTGTATLVTTAPPGGGVWSNGGYWVQGWDASGHKVFSSYY